jgi:protein-S-isoprenylcysteine O-methyltransferase Ste14
MRANFFVRRVANNFLLFGTLGWLLYVVAGTFFVRGFWIFAITALAYQIISLSILVSRYPEYMELAEIRKKNVENAKPWDRTLVMVLMVATLLMYILAGLDIGRWHASELPLALAIPGVLVYILSCALNQWAMVHNRFFERNVRIQTDRDQKVATTGPYRYVRHPGYLGSILFFLSFPMMVGSGIAWLGSALCVLGMVGRTFLEDRTLQAELTGYEGYCQTVQYRLIPRIW